MSANILSIKEMRAYLARVMALLDHPAVLALQHDCEDYSGLVEETGARLEALENAAVVDKVQPMLDLSTAHVPEPKSVRSFKINDDSDAMATAPDFGECRWTAHEFGWVVYISECIDASVVPEWLHPAYKQAMKHKCVLINFDVDGPIHPNLPTWDW